MAKGKKKIGLNEPCPCGSGKKYKKCCKGKEEQNFFAELPPAELDVLKDKFKDYNLSELIATLASLQLLPENHSKTFRLETITKIACSLENVGTHEVKSKEIQNIINENLPYKSDIGKLEDPPENLFTENIIFCGGNYIVYPGISENETQILSKLLEIVHLSKNLFHKHFVLLVEATSLSLLALSNEIANRVNHSRYMISPDTWTEEIELPEDDAIRSFRKAVIFTKEEIDSLLGKYGLNSMFLNPFTLPVGDVIFQENDLQKNPLLIKPLVKIDDKIIVALPSSIMSALRNYIIATSIKMGLHEIIIKKYREGLLADIQDYFRIMLFGRVDIDLPTWDKKLPIEECIFRIDSNKLAYVQLIVDDLTDYNENIVTDIWNPANISEKIYERDQEIHHYLTNGDVPYCQEILNIKVFGTFGRGFSIGFKNISEMRTILLPVENLEVITKLRDCDELTLWKFAEALESNTISPFTSFLDKYAFYHENNYSFHIDNNSDSKKPTYIVITPGYGRELRIKATKNWDKHASLIGSPPHYISVIRRYDEQIPIYVPENAFGKLSGQLVEGYFQPLWIEYINDVSMSAVQGNIFQFIEAIAYWLWQLTPNLKNHLKELGKNPVSIKLCLENPSKWNTFEKTNKDESLEIPDFRTEIRDSSILFYIPMEIQYSLQRADNLGERIIIDNLMQAFGEMLESKGKQNSLIKSERSRIVDIHAPIGYKKKIILLDTSKNIALDSRFIPNLRKIQKHNSEKELDGLVQEFGKKAPPFGEVNDKNERIKLCNRIVEIYHQRLMRKLSVFSWQSVIDQLISYNEALWHYRAFKQLTTITSIECFSDIQSKVKEEVEEVPMIDSTALSLRTLIEIVSAEPPKGNQIISLDDFDNLLAITDHLINWAMISDYIHKEIADYNLIISKSGRVNVEGENIRNIWNPFKENKTLERIESSNVHLEKLYDSGEKEIDSIDISQYQSAFKAEFGLTLEQLANFCGSLVKVGFEQKVAAPSLHLSELKERLKNSLNWNVCDIEKAIRLISLSPRDKWENAPEGFTGLDIWPWRYNRRLSYLRKPIIICPEPHDDPLIYWGPRHVNAAFRQLLDLVESGRYNLYDDTSEEMKVLIGNIKNENGKGFMNQAKEWFVKNTNYLVDSEVPIKPGKQLSSDVDLGDIDILLIAENINKIFLVECKNINFGRNPIEMAQEIDRLIGKQEDKDSWTEKHLKRDKWIKDNINILTNKYDLSNNSFEVCSLFLTSEEIPSVYIRKMPLPIISYSYLVRKGVGVLNRICNE